VAQTKKEEKTDYVHDNSANNQSVNSKTFFGSKKGNDSGDISFAGTAANNTVTNKGIMNLVRIIDLITFSSEFMLTTIIGTAVTASGERVLVTRSDTGAHDEEELNYLTLDYYKQFANVDSSDVLWRCLRSFWPFKFDFVRYVKGSPDIYGPFWVCLTPVLTYSFDFHALLIPYFPLII
jgi:hypothetical protein